MQKNETGPSQTLHKNQLKGFETINLPEEHIRKKFHSICLGKYFLNMTPKTHITKAKVHSGTISNSKESAHQSKQTTE